MRARPLAIAGLAATALLFATTLPLAPRSEAALKTSIILGSGQHSCTYWLAEGRGGGAASLKMQQWLFGFVTSYNLNAHGGDNVARGHSADQLLGWIDGYCKMNREHQLSTAAIALILALTRSK